MPKPKQISIKDAVFPNTQILTAASTISVRAGFAEDIITVSSAANVTLTSNPRIQTSGVSDRQQITIVNLGNFSITIPSGGAVSSAGLSIVIRSGRTATFIYSATLSQWIAISSGSMALQHADAVDISGGKIAGGLVYSGSGVNFNNRSLFQILSGFETADNITSDTFQALSSQAQLKTNLWTIQARLTAFPTVSQLQALVQPYRATTPLDFLQSFFTVGRLEDCIVLVNIGTPSDGLYYLFQNSANNQFSILRVPDSAITLNAGDLIYARADNKLYQVASMSYGVDPLDPFGNEYFYPVVQPAIDLTAITTELSNQSNAITELQSRLIKLGYVSPTFDHPSTNEIKNLMAVSDGTDPDEWLLIRASVPTSGPGSTVVWTPNGIFYKNASNNLVKVPAYESIGSIPEGTQIFSRLSFRYYATIILTDSPTRYFFEEVTPIVQINGSDEILVNNDGGDVTVQLESAFLERIDTIEQGLGEKASLADVESSFAAPPPIGSETPNTGAFTTVEADSIDLRSGTFKSTIDAATLTADQSIFAPDGSGQIQLFPSDFPLPTIFSHFIEGVTTPWGASNSGTGSIVDLNTSEPGITGVAVLNAGSTTTGRATLTSRFSGTSVIPVFSFAAHKQWEFACRFKISNLNDGVNDFNLRLGCMDVLPGTPTNGFGFWYTPGQASWQIFSVNSGTLTQVNTSVVVNTNWNIVRIRRSGLGEISFYMNDVLVGTISTNLPASAGAGAMLVKASGTTPRTVPLDWMFAGARS
ncbi:hypothetical protein NIES2135_53720 [Leptolyngbya boryana NIES-2135]|jgi:hypothetical protein|uniref:Uncharacterized protein n=1 Tax=Leptolyngbya boryana NIES-2135 TaxID=1973484 RepID=A0A1Z4JP51_LEPBY|nr:MULTISPECIES: hypothetical protein [Leptolyngbya]BAY58499.1 hypothetical protein NIES2135_53720 [Leptolyngbya boryana NIES-2135]MBD2370974.1 hypothetical protein [Leptolyngbya sp. FACHB-161]MBD2377488.1 hypothetical protein [Leptolyngbya sp. FACHB-238]MBD2401896.1 hypothetical protein [Leptolyngbya sp. FACHB-239]MBD2408414.1 hypothetical protein [Leptolyngbya sp. FACHB-402]